MMDLVISVESQSAELLDAYAASGMNRGLAGASSIDWTFDGNESAFAVARCNGKIVGISAYIQSTMHFGAERGTAFQAVDSFVDPAMRGQGLFSRLARTYSDHANRHGADLVGASQTTMRLLHGLANLAGPIMVRFRS